MQYLNAAMKECIEQCWQCRTACQEILFNHCLQAGGKHVEAEHVKLMMDCIQSCQTAADFMVRNSSLHKSQCMACADICDACAASCEGIGGEDMKRCAEACRSCAKKCRETSGMKKAA